jgi:hypothetical protein
MSEETKCCGNCEEGSCVEKVEEEKEVLYFTLLTLPSTEHILGVVSDSAYVAWASNKMKLVVRDAKRILPLPMERGNVIVGFNFSFMPLYPEPTRQERLTLDATMVEILGQIETTDGVSYLVGKNIPEKIKGFFNSYTDIVAQWRAELSGLVMPSGKINTDKPLKLV